MSLASIALKCNIDQRLLNAKLQAGTSFAQRWLDLNVAKDTDPYVPALSGHLAGTAYGQRQAAPVGSGKVVYNTKYALRQYYNYPRKTRIRHPHAQMKWFDASKRANQQRWLDGVRRLMGEGWRSK